MPGTLREPPAGQQGAVYAMKTIIYLNYIHYLLSMPLGTLGLRAAAVATGAATDGTGRGYAERSLAGFWPHAPEAGNRRGTHAPRVQTAPQWSTGQRGGGSRAE